MKKNSFNRSARLECANLTAKGDSKEYVEKGVFEHLVDCHNELACYVGVPRVVAPDRITPFPATMDNYGTCVKGYAGYRLNIKPFAGKYGYVRFRGTGNGKDVISGCIIDKNGLIESYKALPDADGWVVLPLTASSHALHASVRTKKGKLLCDDIKIELFGSGMSAKYDATLKELSERLSAIERALIKKPLVLHGNFSMGLC